MNMTAPLFFLYLHIVILLHVPVPPCDILPTETLVELVSGHSGVGHSL